MLLSKTNTFFKAVYLFLFLGCFCTVTFAQGDSLRQGAYISSVPNVLQGDYFPLQLGNTWLFKRTDSNDTLQLRIVGANFDSLGNFNHFTACWIEPIDGKLDTTYFEIEIDAAKTIRTTFEDKNKDFPRFDVIQQPQLGSGEKFQNKQDISYVVTPTGAIEGCLGNTVFQTTYGMFTSSAKGFVYAPDVGPVEYRNKGKTILCLIDFYNICDYYQSEDFALLLNQKKNIFIDDSCGAYNPYEYIVQYKPGIDESIKKTDRKEAEILTYERCVCFPDLELWCFDPTQHTITDVQKKILEAKQGETSDDVGNRNKFAGISNSYFAITRKKFAKASAGRNRKIPVTSNEVMLITLTDSGINFGQLSQEETNYIYYSEGPIEFSNVAGTVKTQSGWDFRNKTDDVSSPLSSANELTHGTLVLKEIIQQLIAANISSNQVKILPLRTHNDNGTGLLFDGICSMYYVDKMNDFIKNNGQIVNASWGYYGERNRSFELAIDSLQKKSTLVVTGAGNGKENKRVTLEEHPFYPAAMKKTNLLAATSLNDNCQISFFGNTSNELVHVGQIAPDGTSYAAPVLTAILVEAKLRWEDDNLTTQQLVDSTLLHYTTEVEELKPHIIDGRVLNVSYGACNQCPECCECPWPLSIFCCSYSCWYCIIVLFLLILLLIWLIKNKLSNRGTSQL